MDPILYIDNVLQQENEDEKKEQRKKSLFKKQTKSTTLNKVLTIRNLIYLQIPIILDWCFIIFPFI